MSLLGERVTFAEHFALRVGSLNPNDNVIRAEGLKNCSRGKIVLSGIAEIATLQELARRRDCCPDKNERPSERSWAGYSPPVMKATETRQRSGENENAWRPEAYIEKIPTMLGNRNRHCGDGARNCHTGSLSCRSS